VPRTFAPVKAQVAGAAPLGNCPRKDTSSRRRLTRQRGRACVASERNPQPFIAVDEGCSPHTGERFSPCRRYHYRARRPNEHAWRRAFRRCHGSASTTHGVNKNPGARPGLNGSAGAFKRPPAAPTVSRFEGQNRALLASPRGTPSFIYQLRRPISGIALGSR